MKILLSILFFLPSISFSQAGIPTAIRINSGEVLQGTIKQRNRTGTKIFIFQPKNTTEKLSISPLDASEVILDENDYFLASVITKYTNQVDIKDFLNNSLYADTRNASLVEKSVADTVFLYRLATGQNISVYKYEDQRVNYFIQKKDGSLSTLRFVIKIDEKDNVHELTYYKNQLSEFTGNDPKLQKRVTAMRWMDNDLIKFADAINNTKTPKKYNRHNGWFIGVGINLMQAGSKHRDTYYPDSLLSSLKYTPSLSPAISFGNEFSKNQESKLILHLSTGAYLFNTKGTHTWVDTDSKSQTETFPIKGFNIAISLSPQFIIFSRPEQKFTLGAGVNMNYTVFGKTKWTTTQLAGTNPVPRVRPNYYLSENTTWFYGYLTSEFWITKNHGVAIKLAPNQAYISSSKTSFYQKNLNFTYICKLSNRS